MRIGDQVRFNGADGEVVAVSGEVRKDWEGIQHPEWPPMVRVKWLRGRRTWLPPDILELVAVGSPMVGHDSECESRRKVQVFRGVTYCASCSGSLTPVPTAGVAGVGHQPAEEEQ